MANYIDGFVFPISRDGLSEYKSLAESVTDNAHMESFFRSMKTETTKGIEFRTE